MHKKSLRGAARISKSKCIYLLYMKYYGYRRRRRVIVYTLVLDFWYSHNLPSSRFLRYFYYCYYDDSNNLFVNNNIVIIVIFIIHFGVWPGGDALPLARLLPPDDRRGRAQAHWSVLVQVPRRRRLFACVCRYRLCSWSVCCRRRARRQRSNVLAALQFVRDRRVVCTFASFVFVACSRAFFPSPRPRFAR